MKIALLSLCLLFAAGCGSKTDDAQPAAKGPAAPAVSYTDPGGVPVVVSSWVASTGTAPPVVPGQGRRAVTVRALLANGYTVGVTFGYSLFYGAGIPVALNGTIDAVYNLGTTQITSYSAPTTAGTLTVDSPTPQVVSGTYTGPLTAGGPAVSFTFSKLPI